MGDSTSEGYLIEQSGAQVSIKSLGILERAGPSGHLLGRFEPSAPLTVIRVERINSSTLRLFRAGLSNQPTFHDIALPRPLGNQVTLLGGFNRRNDGLDDIVVVDTSEQRYAWYVIDEPLTGTAAVSGPYFLGERGDLVEWYYATSNSLQFAAVQHRAHSNRVVVKTMSGVGETRRVFKRRWRGKIGGIIPLRTKARRRNIPGIALLSADKRKLFTLRPSKGLSRHSLPNHSCSGSQITSGFTPPQTISSLELCNNTRYIASEYISRGATNGQIKVGTGALPSNRLKLRRADATTIDLTLGELPVLLPIIAPPESSQPPTATPASQESPSPSATPTSTSSSTWTPSPNNTPEATPPLTATATLTFTATATPIDTPASTPTDTPTSTPSATPSAAPSPNSEASNPRNVGASIGRASEVRIIWEVPVYGRAPSEYVIFRSTSGPPSTELSPLATISGYEYIDTSAVNGTTYYYRVSSRSPDGSISAGVVVEGKALSPSAARDSSLLFVASGVATGGDGSIGNPYNSISSAIAAVDSLGTVVVLPGTHNLASSITVDKSITVRSQQGAYEESGGAILRGPNSFENSSWTGHFEVFLVTADGVTISGLTFTQFSLANPNWNQSAMITHGAVASPIKNLTIHNNRFIKNRANVTSSMSFSTMRDQQTGWHVTSNYIGLMPASSNSILAHFWKDCQITDNIIVNSNFAGVQTLDISNCTITHNLVVNSTAYSIKLGCASSGSCNDISITKNVLIGAIASAYSGAMRLSPNVVGTLTVSDNIIQNTVKSAVYFDAGGSFNNFTFEFKRNRLENSGGNALLITTTSGSVDATQNWWGSPSGPNVGGDPDSETIAAGSSSVNSSAHLTGIPYPRFSGGKRLVSIAIAGWTTAPRGTKQLNAIGTFSDASVSDVSELAIWYSSDSSVVSVNDTNDKGQATALREGSATVTAIVDGIVGTSLVTVNSATMLAQLGDLNGGYQKINPSTGALIGSQFVSGRSFLRGMLSLPGGFISLGCAAPHRTEFFNYSGGIPSSPLIIQDVTNCPHGISSTWDGKLLVADYDAYRINLHDGESGSLISHFATGDLSSPFRAVELEDRRIIAGSWAGKLVAYSRYGGTIAKIGDFATGFNQVWGLDYCSRDNRILVSEYGNRRVSSCTASGVCSVLANHGKSGPLALRIDRNSGDCSFFVGFEDGQIRRFAADGTPTASPLVDLPQQVFDLDFEWPVD